MSHRADAAQQRGSLLISLDLDALDPRDSHDLLCSLRQNSVSATWITKHFDHGWLRTVCDTSKQEIGLRWNATTAIREFTLATKSRLSIDSLIIEKKSQVSSFRPAHVGDAIGLWMDAQLPVEYRASRVGAVGSGVCEVSVSSLLPKMTSVWNDRVTKCIRRSITAGQDVHLRIQSGSGKGPTVATRLERLLRLYASNVASIRDVARAALQAKTSRPSRSILRPAA